MNPRILLDRAGDTRDLVTLPEKRVHAGSDQPVGQHTTSIYSIACCIVAASISKRPGMGWKETRGSWAGASDKLQTMRKIFCSQSLVGNPRLGSTLAAHILFRFVANQLKLLSWHKCYPCFFLPACSLPEWEWEMGKKVWQAWRCASTGNGQFPQLPQAPQTLCWALSFSHFPTFSDCCQLPHLTTQ